MTHYGVLSSRSSQILRGRLGGTAPSGSPLPVVILPPPPRWGPTQSTPADHIFRLFAPRELANGLAAAFSPSPLPPMTTRSARETRPAAWGEPLSSKPAILRLRSLAAADGPAHGSLELESKAPDLTAQNKQTYRAAAYLSPGCAPTRERRRGAR